MAPTGSRPTLEELRAAKRQRAQLHRGIHNLALGALFVAALLAVIVACWRTPDRAFSDAENRRLAQAPDFLDAVTAAGAVVVNDSYVDVTLAGQPLRIGGTFGHAFPFGRTAEEFAASPEYRFLTAFEDTDRPTVCLAHMPDTFIFNGAAGYWDVDLVLSGHTHGGLIRLPWVGGLYAPMQGWFPPYDRGQFWLSDTMQLIITSGLAGYKAVPRVNNLPEIAVVTLTSAA